MSIIKYQDGAKLTPQDNARLQYLPQKMGNPYTFLKDLYRSDRIKQMVLKHRGWPDLMNQMKQDEEVLNVIKQDPHETKLVKVLNESLRNSKKIMNESTQAPLKQMQQSKLNTDPKQDRYKDEPGTLGYTRSGEDEIYMFPYKFKGQYRIPQQAYVHEMTHKIYPHTLGYVTDEILNEDSHVNKTSLADDEVAGDPSINYLQSKTEKLQRINELRYLLYNLGLHDATKHDFTKEDYDAIIKLNNPFINALLNQINSGSIHKKNETLRPFSKEEMEGNIIKLMNEIAQNKPKQNNITSVRKGGMINYKKGTQ